MRIRTAARAIVARSTRRLAALILVAPSIAAAQECAPAWDMAFPGLAPNGIVQSAAVGSMDGAERIFVGGGFQQIDGVAASRIAQFDGESWSALGGGVNNRVNALVLFDDGAGLRLFAGGAFSTAAGAFAPRIAAWDGTQWASVGGGVQSTSTTIIRALAIYDDGAGDALYAAGVFATAGGQPVSNIARWDGAAWSPLGAGLNGPVYALCAHDDGSGEALYAAGGFTATGDGAVLLSRVGKWDGESWAPVGDGLDNDVLAIASAPIGAGPARLFIGGHFTVAGGATPVAYIAELDEGAWAPVGSGMSHPVRALAPYDDGAGAALAVGGDFGSAGGTPALLLARYGVEGWSALGGGLNGFTTSGVHALGFGVMESRPTLIAVGLFNEPTDNAARWIGCEAAALAGDLTGDGAVNGADLGLLLGAWGASDDPADLNEDGDVNGADLGLLLGSWTG